MAGSPGGVRRTRVPVACRSPVSDRTPRRAGARMVRPASTTAASRTPVAVGPGAVHRVRTPGFDRTRASGRTPRRQTGAAPPALARATRRTPARGRRPSRRGGPGAAGSRARMPVSTSTRTSEPTRRHRVGVLTRVFRRTPVGHCHPSRRAGARTALRQARTRVVSRTLVSGRTPRRTGLPVARPTRVWMPGPRRVGAVPQPARSKAISGPMGLPVQTAVSPRTLDGSICTSG